MSLGTAATILSKTEKRSEKRSIVCLVSDVALGPKRRTPYLRLTIVRCVKTVGPEGHPTQWVEFNS